MSEFTYRIAKMFVKVDYFSLPNILLKRAVLPELLQAAVSAENIAQWTEKLLEPKKQSETKALLTQVKSKLGEKDVALRTANLIIETIERENNEKL